MSELETIETMWRRDRASYLKEMAREGLLDYCRALLAIAGADGVVSEPEMRWLRDQLVEHTGTDLLLDELRAFNYQNADLHLILARIATAAAALEEHEDPMLPGNLRMSLLYDSIRMAWADDDLPLEERQAISRAARFLGIDESTCRALNGLVEMENAVRKLKFGLLGM